MLTTKKRKKKGTSSLHLLKEEEKEIKLENENNSDSNIIPHHYSDITPFKRLMTAMRLILNKPFLRDDHKKSLNLFVDTLSQEQGIAGKCRDQFRKDIEYILKPFQIRTYAEPLYLVGVNSR